MPEFQIYDWSEGNEDSKYIINVFGRTLDDRSVYCKITKYLPYFYIEVPVKLQSDQEPVLKFIIANNFKKPLLENDKIPKKIRSGIHEVSLVKLKSSEGFTNNKELFFIKIEFKNLDSYNKIKNYFDFKSVDIQGFTEGSMNLKLYDQSQPPMLKCFHEKNILGCGWIYVDDKYYVDQVDRISTCNIEFAIPWTEIKPIYNNYNAPLRICSFDIEVYSVDGQFPQASRPDDCIIQIGATYTKLGESTPYRKYIGCLDKTDDVDDTVTKVYQNEKDLILGFIKEINMSDCDILTGYNIFFFDEKYIYDRTKILNFNIEDFSKFLNHITVFKEIKCSSAAMGDNLLKFYDTPGIVHIDLMREIKNNYKLSSYKLDSVASSFIKGKITDLKIQENYIFLYSKTTNINKGDYIHIEVEKEFVSDILEGKFEVKDVTKEFICIDKSESLLNNINSQELSWTQAKDDVSAKDIFRMYKGTSYDRYIIAKYCIKDCILCGILCNKLDIIVKNIEMANVCHIPLCYLSYRGQGIKLLSLCAKEFAIKGYAFKASKKSTSTKSSYEGAIVFDPIPAVEREAIAVKDYNSLYPSSMIHKNMSHETLVIDKQYDNLENVEYFNVEYDEDINGKKIKKYNKFAKLNNDLGVIPSVLVYLLDERKRIKKLMKSENDNEKYKLLDAKQYALKITANSLYGQLGAPTSYLFNKDIAAATTATGREMLLYAKEFDEDELPIIINSEKYHYNTTKKLSKNSRIPEEYIEYIKSISKYTFSPIVRYGDTDSIFTCYRFRENCKALSCKDSLEIYKCVKMFFPEMIKPYIPPHCVNDYFSLSFFTSIVELVERNKINLIHDRIHKWTTLKLNKSNLFPVDLRKNRYVAIVPEISEKIKEILFPKCCFEIPSNESIEIFEKWMKEDSPVKSEITDNVNVKALIKIVKEKWAESDQRKIKTVRDLQMITEEYITKILKLSMDKYIENHIDLIVNFINTKMKNNGLFRYIMKFKYNNEEMVKVYEGGEPIIDKRSIDLTIKMGKLSSELMKLPYPHKCEYEKSFWPIIFVTKKRYVGNKYEYTSDKFKRDYLGIVLARRDNAPIVKEVCSGIINRLLSSSESIIEYLKEMLDNMFQGKYDINYFIQSRTLKIIDTYKDWKKIAHAVLAKRIEDRDIGNVPQPGDRIQYVAIKKFDDSNKKLLQGEFIETLDYIKENKSEINYLFYLTNQIEKPISQFLELTGVNYKSIFKEYIDTHSIKKPIKLPKAKSVTNKRPKIIDPRNHSE